MEKKIDGKEALKKGAKLIDEFKAFVLRGNIVDMAVGVIIGSAFGNIVKAFTDDFIQPLIDGIGGAKVGGEIKIYGGQALKYGDFLTNVINFIIMAFVLFMILKGVNALIELGKKKDAEEDAPKKSDETVLLEEIRDLLKKQNKTKN